MSFSTTIKEELARHYGNGRHCQLAEIAALIIMSGNIKIISNQEASIKFQTENPTVARKYFTLIKKTFNINTEVLIRRNSYLKKKRVYILIIADTKKSLNILKAIKLVKHNINNQVFTINRILIQSTCCKRAYLRGAFLAAGSLSDPEKTYHLEFVNQEKEHSELLKEIINYFKLGGKIIKRKKYYIVYLKEGTCIVDLLNIMEAHIALMNLENVRILKEMRNNINRLVNCETANLNKTVEAAVKQLEDIQIIEHTIGLNKLQKPLQEIATLRLQYPSASLKELGTYLSPPVGKSGVNHRLRKLKQIAEKFRENKEENYD